MHVCYSFLDDTLSEDLFSQLLSTMPPQIQRKVMTYKPMKSRWHVLTGKILLKKLLHMNGLDTTLNQMNVETTGRPYLSKDFDFNISHSGDYVICAISDVQRVGVDIEKIRHINLDAFRRYMTTQQWQDITMSTDRLKKFFHYWTIKEAVLKADGKGIAGGLLSVDTYDGIATLEGKKWFYREIMIDEDYSCHIASDKGINTVNIIRHNLSSQHPP